MEVDIDPSLHTRVAIAVGRDFVVDSRQGFHSRGNIKQPGVVGEAMIVEVFVEIKVVEEIVIVKVFDVVPDEVQHVVVETISLCGLGGYVSIIRFFQAAKIKIGQPLTPFQMNLGVVLQGLIQNYL